MGEWKKPRNVTLGPDAEREIRELQDLFWPRCKSRSEMLRELVSLSHTIFIKKPEVVPHVQRALQEAGYVFVMRIPSEVVPAKVVGFRQDALLVEQIRSETDWRQKRLLPARLDREREREMA